MNNEIKPEKYRKLSVAALVTGIISISLLVLYNFLWMVIATILEKFLTTQRIPNVIIPFMVIILGLSITAVVCGSIDLKRIKVGVSSKKGKGFDIAGIVLGSIFILFALMFVLGEIIFPH